MTPKEFVERIAELRDAWAVTSNATKDQEELFRLGESFIEELDKSLLAVGGHPEPPPPRIRP